MFVYFIDKERSGRAGSLVALWDDHIQNRGWRG